MGEYKGCLSSHFMDAILQSYLFNNEGKTVLRMALCHHGREGADTLMVGRGLYMLAF